VLVAKEAATLDVLSDGRFELGLGAGGSWMPDYEATGIAFDPPGTRVARLEESLRAIKGLLAKEPVTFTGRHYALSAFEGFPKPIQQPHPPILVGGGGPRMLALAAREADVVGVLPTLLPGGGHFHMAECSAEAVAAKIEAVRQAAGARFADLELNVLLQRVVVTDDARPVSEDLSRDWTPLTPAEILETPHLLIGSIDGIVEALLARRERFGISYLVAFERDAEAFAPIVARLAGA
jgi:probable F420-dependent oxidoreductase